MTKNSTVSVIGLGYVGLPMLHLLSKKNLNVFGFDKDANKINLLKKNISYITDLNSKQIKIINKNNLFDMSNLEMIQKSDFIVFCLPTPYTNNKPDVSMIVDAFESIRNYLKKNQTIILESTVYPGATEKIFTPYLKKNFKLGKNFFLCYSPERLSPGQIDKKNYKFTLENTIKVISGYNILSLKKIFLFYSKVFKKVYKAESLQIAEMAKLVENSYRSVNIGLVNELKMICKNINLDVHKVLRTASTKPFGFNIFHPGPGVGGHCIPIDPLFINWIAKKSGASSNFINLARLTNLKITDWVINQMLKFEKKIESKKIKKKILVIGLAYKADVNDTRESPSIIIIKKLIKLNNQVDYYDNKIPSFNLGKKIIKSINLNNISKYDYVVIATDHSDLNKKYILKNSKKIFDTRGIFSEIENKKIIKI